jgi:hypothetical protein
MAFVLHRGSNAITGDPARQSNAPPPAWADKPSDHLKLKRTNINNVPRDVDHESQGGGLEVIGTRNAHIRA